MKLYNEPDFLIKQILYPSNCVNTESYKKSIFVYDIKMDENNYLLYNLLTGAIITLNKSEHNQIYKSNTDTHKFLCQNYFFVSKEIDEVKNFYNIKNIFKAIKQSQKGITKYTILTTTECNARCFYCFEEGIQKETMSIKTAKDVADYIINTSCGEKIVLQWFGGEPLCNTIAIREICEKLKEKGISYSSSITTNGILLNEKLLLEIIDLWHLETATITLDGTEEQHNIRKNLYDSSINAFQRSITNIESLLKNGIYVKLRINFDSENFEDCKKLAYEISKKYDRFLKYLSVEPVLLYGERDSLEGYKMLFELRKYFGRLKIYLPSKPKSFLLNTCKSNNLNSIVITPSGKLCACEHAEPNMIFGDIYSKTLNKDIYSYWVKDSIEYRYEACSNCVFLPQCHFIYGRCPIKCNYPYCQLNMENIIDNALLEYIEKTGD